MLHILEKLSEFFYFIVKNKVCLYKIFLKKSLQKLNIHKIILKRIFIPKRLNKQIKTKHG